MRIHDSRHPATAVEILRVAWWPCTLSALTTAIGLIALLSSSTAPVRQFGIYSAIGVLFGTGLILLTLPGFLERCPFVFPRLSQNTSPGECFDRDRRIEKLVDCLKRWRWAVFTVFAGIMSFSLLGLPRLDTSLNIGSTFSPQTKIFQDTQWIESNVRSLSQIEVSIQFRQECELTSSQRLLVLAKCQSALQEIAEVSRVFSPSDFVPSEPSGRSVGATIRRSLYRNKLAQMRRDFVEMNYLSQQGGSEWWRISVMVPSLPRSNRLFDVA
ncbi:RND transporter family protein [Novipirellula artificiosorum]|uniref:Uncharacterized protein n=1 Tax=Novipirellula artificiosorum TaxID=2528016 RepID=A0A5C6DDB0_9BACT|nr:hypothetical protein [Novipirellula artificiosorum]TWU34235.1 hypothetical protein Poly41_43810 [Novipirellula artificiosorum]